PITSREPSVWPAMTSGSASATAATSATGHRREDLHAISVVERGRCPRAPRYHRGVHRDGHTLLRPGIPTRGHRQGLLNHGQQRRRALQGHCLTVHLHRCAHRALTTIFCVVVLNLFGSAAPRSVTGGSPSSTAHTASAVRG